MTALLLALAGLLGSAIGSFLNVVVWRVPRGASVVSPPSACPACGHPIRPRDNVPVLSWLALRGRCRDCGDPISRRYPCVEAATGALFVLATAWVLLGSGPAGVLPALLYLVSVAVALALIDVDTHRLPDAIVLPSYPVAAVLLTVASATSGDWAALARSAAGLAALGGFYVAVRLVYPRGMGLGDVKLAGLLGAYLGWFGWGALVVGGFSAFVLGGLHALVLVAARRAGRRTAMPFGPWMLAGAMVGVVAGEPLWNAYLGALT